MLSSRLVLLANLFLALTFSAQAQSAAPDDEALIRATVQTYFDGWATGDTTKLSAAMHATCQLKSVNNGAFGVRDKRSYLSVFKPRPRGDTQARILTLHHTGHAAAVVRQITSGPNRFTDYFNMLRLNGRWFITDKVAIREDLAVRPK